MRASLVLSAIGLVVMLLGAYVAGGDEVTCARLPAPSLVAERTEATPAAGAAAGTCRVRTVRWLGLHTRADRSYARVTSVQSDIDTTRTWSLRLMNGGAEVARITSSRNRVTRAAGTLDRWLADDSAATVRVDFSDWGFAYASIGFGIIWLLLILGAAGRSRSAGRASGQTSPNAPAGP